MASNGQGPPVSRRRVFFLEPGAQADIERESAGRAAAVASAERPQSRKVRAPRKHGAGQRPAGETPGKAPQKANRPACIPAQPLLRGQSSLNAGGARVKGWGKSPPRGQQCRRHGKPHREQDRIGTMRRKPGLFPAPVVRVGCLRRLATGVPEEWSPRPCSRGHGPYRTRLTGRLTFFPRQVPRPRALASAPQRTSAGSHPMERRTKPGATASPQRARRSAEV